MSIYFSLKFFYDNIKSVILHMYRTLNGLTRLDSIGRQFRRNSDKLEGLCGRGSCYLAWEKSGEGYDG